MDQPREILQAKVEGAEAGASLATSNRPMALGAGFYWAAALLQATDTAAAYGADSQTLVFASEAVLLASNLVFLLAMVFIALFAGRFVRPRTQKVLAAATVLCAAAVIVAESPLFPASAAKGLFALAVRYAGNACAVMFWGLCFAAQGRHGAEKTTLDALTVALVLYLIGSMFIADETVLTYATQAAIMVSTFPFLLGRYRIDLVRRPDATPNRKLLAPFYASRAFFGVCMGATTYLCMRLVGDADARSSVICLVGLVIALAFFWKRPKADANELAKLRFTPFIACVVLLCPFLASQNLTLAACRCAPAFIWVGWMILHSVQVSAVKERAGLDDAALSFSEKITFEACALATMAVMSAVPALSTLLEGDEALVIAATFALVIADVLVCAYQLTLTIDEKETERIVDAAFELTDQRLEPVLAQLGEKFGLTSRELDVLRLLAKGMTRPAICEELCVSANTVRTHMDHLYKKMDIHSRDELLAIVDAAAREYVAR